MNGFQSIISGYVFTSFFVMAISAQSGDTFPDSFIGFDSVPDQVADGSVVRVHYRCSGPCQLTVEVVDSTVRNTDLVAFRRKWSGGAPRAHGIQQVLLRWPPSISRRLRFFSGNTLHTRNVTLRAWLDGGGTGEEIGTYRGSTWKICKELQVTLPPRDCPSWSAQLIQQTTIHQCPHETDAVDMLTFPFASTGEHFGVVRRFQPFVNRALETARLQAAARPSVTFSAWIYLLKRCQSRRCGIIHHVNGRNLYDSVLLQLSDSGEIIIQAHVTTGEDEAFQAAEVMPLWKWIRLDCYILGSKVVLISTWDEETHRSEYEFQSSINFDDTDGYFVIGGGKYMPGIHGYFGPVKYYRLGTEEVKNDLHPKSTLQGLERAHQKCQEIKRFTKAFLHEVTKTRPLSPANKVSAVCVPDFLRLWGQLGGKDKTCPQTWTWESQLEHQAFFHFLLRSEAEIGTGSFATLHLRKTLFDLAVGEIFPAVEAEKEITLQSMALLKAASCFGNHRASLLLAATHLSGLGGSVDQEEGHVYSLIGALADDRFSLMHAGYKHTYGADGFPKDLHMAYGYYSNAAAQSSIDISQEHKNKYTPEYIYLSNDDYSNSLTDETSDLFQYLKFEAERGDTESQRRLGTMLYWGQNGISKDPASAVKWFERSAMQMKDPSAMYEYSVLLMKGQGVKRNYTRGFQLLQKAAAMGSINALNGLGWYHGTVLNDHESAVRYFQQAAANGSAEGMFNLGVYHLSGKNPEKPWRNESAAFQLFLNASRFGHVAASVEAAWYLSTGSLQAASQDVERAVTMLKKVCEQNGHLGFMIREGLLAYVQGCRMRQAFVSYVLAAETGLGVAQGNAAHLCEELDLKNNCQWRYLNYSILDPDPHPSALLKMGDYYYDYFSSSTREDSLSLAEQSISMYSRAALAGSPQGMFSLAVLAQRGHTLPPSVLGLFNASRRDEPDSVVEKILQRCVDSEDDESVGPCFLALLGLQMRKAQKRMTQNHAELLLMYASLLSILVIMVALPLHSCLERRRGPLSRNRRASSVGQHGADLDRALVNRWLTVNGERRLQRASELALTLAGVCLCSFWTALLCHLL
ncbi:unnamed protein product [Menidia menidia]|uniref:(Atlantic silverside) hypothetical protein n=1 Tax=Menidia menidia TaxID=238744 RepID=A0A8S4A8C4_9TELE|nr:unnamed protein product [Menidia menidia]